jgi:hypothetical protein
MKVKELIEKLQTFNEELEIAISHYDGCYDSRSLDVIDDLYMEDLCLTKINMEAIADYADPSLFDKTILLISV